METQVYILTFTLGASWSSGASWGRWKARWSGKFLNNKSSNTKNFWHNITYYVSGFVLLWLKLIICFNPQNNCYVLGTIIMPIFSSSQFSHSAVSYSLWPHEQQEARSPCPSPTPGVYPNSCPSSQWCHPAISSSAVLFSSHPQSFPTSGSFQMSQLFTSGVQSIGVSASTSVLPMNTQDWSPLGWTGWISLQSKGLSRVFFNTTVQKHQLFSAQLPL